MVVGAATPGSKKVSSGIGLSPRPAQGTMQLRVPRIVEFPTHFYQMFATNPKAPLSRISWCLVDGVFFYPALKVRSGPAGPKQASTERVSALITEDVAVSFVCCMEGFWPGMPGIKAGHSDIVGAVENCWQSS